MRDSGGVLSAGKGIDGEVISQCIRKGILYESRNYHNCVFVGKDSAGKARYACLRGIYGTFKNDVDGSDKRYSFSLPSADEDSPFVAVAESPIDALSVASLLKMQGRTGQRTITFPWAGRLPVRCLRSSMTIRQWSASVYVWIMIRLEF